MNPREGIGSLTDAQAGYPEDYHDYVFKDGKLVGDFDNMYRHSQQVPWEQDKRYARWYAQVGLLMLRERAPFESVLEIGCGLGYIATQLKDLSANQTHAFDISSEAIRRARELHPGIDFYVDDACNPDFRPLQQYQLVVVRDLFWYVFRHMACVIENINQCVAPGGYLYIGQSFPRLDRPYVGKDVIPNPDAIVAYMSSFDPIYTALLRNHELSNDGPVLHFLGVKKA